MSEQLPKSNETPRRGKKIVVETAAAALATTIAVSGAGAAHAETGNDTPVDAAQRINQLSEFSPNPMDAALDSGQLTIDRQGNIIELAHSSYENEPGAYEYDPANTCHARDAEWLAEHGQPSAYIKFVYERAGIDPETATPQQKIDAFKDAMWDCYTKDPYVFAGNALMLEHSTDGVVITQEMINEYGTALAADSARWREEVEQHMSIFESSDSTCSVGRAEAGKHFSLYESNVDNPDGTYGIYMGGPSHITSDILIVQVPNGQIISLKECLQPAWSDGDELHIPSGGIPHMIVDLPQLPHELCEPDVPVIPPIVPIIPIPKDFAGPSVDRPVPPVAIVPDKPGPLAGPAGPSYAEMTGGGIDKRSTIGKAHKGYGTIATHHKQPTYLNEGNFSGNRKGRGRTSTVRSASARRGR